MKKFVKDINTIELVESNYHLFSQSYELYYKLSKMLDFQDSFGLTDDNF